MGFPLLFQSSQGKHHKEIFQIDEQAHGILASGTFFMGLESSRGLNREQSQYFDWDIDPGKLMAAMPGVKSSTEKKLASPSNLFPLMNKLLAQFALDAFLAQQEALSTKDLSLTLK